MQEKKLGIVILSAFIVIFSSMMSSVFAYTETDIWNGACAYPGTYLNDTVFAGGGCNGGAVDGTRTQTPTSESMTISTPVGKPGYVNITTIVGAINSNGIATNKPLQFNITDGGAETFASASLTYSHASQSNYVESFVYGKIFNASTVPTQGFTAVGFGGSPLGWKVRNTDNKLIFQLRGFFLDYVTVNISGTPTSGERPLAVQFASTVTGGNGSYSYVWNFGDGGTSSSLANPSHTYTRSGTYSASLQVTDGLSLTNSSNTLSVTVQPNQLDTLLIFIATVIALGLIGESYRRIRMEGGLNPKSIIELTFFGIFTGIAIGLILTI